MKFGAARAVAAGVLVDLELPATAGNGFGAEGALAGGGEFVCLGADHRLPDVDECYFWHRGMYQPQ